MWEFKGTLIWALNMHTKHHIIMYTAMETEHIQWDGREPIACNVDSVNTFDGANTKSATGLHRSAATFFEKPQFNHRNPMRH